MKVCRAIALFMVLTAVPTVYGNSQIWCNASVNQPGSQARVELKKLLKWAIGHEGVVIFDGNSAIVSPYALRDRYYKKLDQYDQCLPAVANDQTITEVSLEAAADLRREFDIKNLVWVCREKDMGAAFRQAVSARPPNHNFVRENYYRLQANNPEVRNMLAAWWDQDLTNIVMNDAGCPVNPPRPAPTHSTSTPLSERGGDHHNLIGAGTAKNRWPLFGLVGTLVALVAVVAVRRRS
jgi:hypothetical protein